MRMQVRTLNPAEADIFFWLDSSYGCSGNVGYITEYILKQAEYLNLHNPSWRAHGGANHAYYLVQDRAGMDYVPVQLQQAIQICQFGAKARLRRAEEEPERTHRQVDTPARVLLAAF